MQRSLFTGFCKQQFNHIFRESIEANITAVLYQKIFNFIVIRDNTEPACLLNKDSYYDQVTAQMVSIKLSVK